MVISASPQDWQTLKQIIDDLDTPRVQIFVQAVIVEVSAERQRELGVSFYSNGLGGGSVFGVGAINFGQLQNSLGRPARLHRPWPRPRRRTPCVRFLPRHRAGSSDTGTTTGTTYHHLKLPCDLALMTALETDTHANVLSAPTLLTADNEEAMIVVGQNLPFVGSASANAGLPGQIFNSVDRQNVGITLDIVPQVSEGDYVKLDLYEEVSNVVNGTQNATLGSHDHYPLRLDHRADPEPSHRGYRRPARQPGSDQQPGRAVHLEHPGARQPVQQQIERQAEGQPDRLPDAAHRPQQERAARARAGRTPAVRELARPQGNPRYAGLANSRDLQTELLDSCFARGRPERTLQRSCRASGT